MMVLEEENTLYRVDIFKEEMHVSVLNYRRKGSFLQEKGRRKFKCL